MTEVVVQLKIPSGEYEDPIFSEFKGSDYLTDEVINSGVQDLRRRLHGFETANSNVEFHYMVETRNERLLQIADSESVPEGENVKLEFMSAQIRDVTPLLKRVGFDDVKEWDLYNLPIFLIPGQEIFSTLGIVDLTSLPADYNEIDLISQENRAIYQRKAFLHGFMKDLFKTIKTENLLAMINQIDDYNLTRGMDNPYEIMIIKEWEDRPDSYFSLLRDVSKDLEEESMSQEDARKLFSGLITEFPSYSNFTGFRKDIEGIIIKCMNFEDVISLRNDPQIGDFIKNNGKIHRKSHYSKQSLFIHEFSKNTEMQMEQYWASPESYKATLFVYVLDRIVNSNDQYFTDEEPRELVELLLDRELVKFDDEEISDKTPDRLREIVIKRFNIKQHDFEMLQPDDNTSE